MSTLISTSDYISLLKQKASTRVFFFKVFITPMVALRTTTECLDPIVSGHIRGYVKGKVSSCFCFLCWDMFCEAKHQKPASQNISCGRMRQRGKKSEASNNKILQSYCKSILVDNTATCNPLQNNYKLIRPLLHLSRTDISLICEKLRIPLYPDKSNQSLKYSRNRIRKQLLPTLKLLYNAQIEQALFTFAEFVSNEQDFMDILSKGIPKKFLSK